MANSTLQTTARALETASLDMVDLAGDLEALSGAFAEQVSNARHMHQHAGTVAARAGEITEAGQLADSAAQEAGSMVTRSAGLVRSASSDMQALGTEVGLINDGLGGLDQTLAQVARAAAAIDAIARTTNLLAINAAVEAMHAGDAGRGFAVVAGEVKSLAEKTSSATTQIHTMLAALSEQARGLLDRGKATAGLAQTVQAASVELGGTMTQLESAFAQVVDGNHRIAGAAADISHRTQELTLHTGAVSQAITDAEGRLSSGRSRVARTSATLEGLVETLAADEDNRCDRPYVERVQKVAARVSALFEQAIAQGRITREALFTRRYRPIPGTNPQQLMAPFTELTDQLLTDLQEQVLANTPGAVFCAAVDSNGYLPTHNRKFSQPQSSDPDWNNANCRNRRIFDDRVGLAAGRNTNPFKLQVYRRDMGGGHFVMMKDVCAPIIVHGRHWGGMRLAYRTD